MFFSTYVLTKKGPLAKVWLAAHWDRRLTRHEVKVVDLSQTILHIVKPVVPIALRTSGELLVGVVRIYALKVRHLLKDATEATLLLRVATVTSKAAASSADDKTTAMDGMLVNQKGDVEAVTLDWSADLAAKHGSFPEAAEALAEARFDAIADLLGAQQVSGLQRDDGLVASAWYTVEPSSQGVEELHNTQQDYDEIAKMRADLLAFGERASNSTSKSKSSLSSVEKGRGSIAVGDGAALPIAGDELDIGIPIPEEIPLLSDTQLAAGLMPQDPFALPEMLESTDLVAAPQVPFAGRKVRPTNIIDMAATTLPREVFEKFVNDRRDILNAEPRRGPMDEAEEADRCTIARSNVPTSGNESLLIADSALLSAQPSAALKAVYASVLHQQVAEAVEEAQNNSQPFRLSELNMGMPIPEDEEEVAAQLPANDRKRLRGDDDNAAEAEEAGSLSHGALQTLQRLRTEIVKGSKRKLSQSTPELLVGQRCTFQGMCQSSGLSRREAAKAFVGVLALASKQIVAAHQGNGGEVSVQLLEASATVQA